VYQEAGRESVEGWVRAGNSVVTIETEGGHREGAKGEKKKRLTAEVAENAEGRKKSVRELREFR
jgi:hypothetical protein